MHVQKLDIRKLVHSYILIYICREYEIRSPIQFDSLKQIVRIRSEFGTYTEKHSSSVEYKNGRGSAMSLPFFIFSGAVTGIFIS